MDGLKLLRVALAGVRLIVCPRCDGEGRVGLKSLRATCPRCLGCGLSTNGANLTPNTEVTK